MRAVWLREFGPPEVLTIGEAPEPQAGPGQVVVQIAAAGITFVETQVRAGMMRIPGLGSNLPLIPGNGVAGTVISTGADVDPDFIGRRVVTSTGGSGGYAEQVAVDASALIPIPDELSFLEAVTLLADGRTAMALIEAARVNASERVLVPAAGGGVGSLLVQLVANAGGYVIAAAGEARKLELARELGAAVTVSYAEPEWIDQVRRATDDSGVDLAFDGVGGVIGRAAFELVAPGGRFVLFGLASGSVTDASLAEIFFRRLSQIATPQIRSPQHNRALIEQALAEAAAGRLRPVIGQTFPLEQTAVAHAAIESRATIGKTLLIP